MTFSLTIGRTDIQFPEAARLNCSLRFPSTYLSCAIALAVENLLKSIKLQEHVVCRRFISPEEVMNSKSHASQDRKILKQFPERRKMTEEVSQCEGR